jgi:ferredoxin-NADP reductase
MSVIMLGRDAPSIAAGQPLRLTFGTHRAAGLPVDLVHTRCARAGQPVGRLDAAAVRVAVPAQELRPLLHVCGPTRFLETVANALVDAGHQEAAIRTERFGPSGG